MMHTLKCVPNDDDDAENDELLWVKAGEPGEKPTIIRQIRPESSTSSSSRDNSEGSTGCNNTRRNLLTVENGTVYRTQAISSDSLHTLEKLKRTSSNDSRVIVVNINEQVYPANVDRQRIKLWRELHSPGVDKRLKTNPINNNNNNTLPKNTSKFIHTKLEDNSRPHSQPTTSSSGSPNTERCASSASPFIRIKALKGYDEGYTSLSEDCKDSDTESVRSKSLPSSWKPTYLNKQSTEQNMQKYAERIALSTGGANFISGDAVQTLDTEKKDQKTQRIRHRVEDIVEVCTCFVCLRSAIYHAEDEDDTDSLVDHPCSCEKPGAKCCGRWSVIGLMVIFLPLLIFYPPLKCCLNIYNSRKKRKTKKKRKDTFTGK